jgi:hypothetical protein
MIPCRAAPPGLVVPVWVERRSGAGWTVIKDEFMEYPVWDLAMGGALLMDLVAIPHVIVSHFAVFVVLLVAGCWLRVWRPLPPWFVGC